MMDKIYRNSVSVDVALSSSAKRLAGKAINIANPRSSAETPLYQDEAHEPSVGSNKLKALTRPFARFIFRLSKPFLKPFAFRLRQYMARTLVEELETAKQSLKHDIMSANAEAQQTLKHVSRSLLALEHLSISLREEVREAREVLNQATARVSEEAREARELLNQATAHVSRARPILERVEQYSLAAAHRFALPCGDGETLVRTSVGYVLCPSTDHALLAQLIDTGELEPGTRQLIQRFLSPGDMFVDVGANVGLHTIAAARAMHGVGKIVAFEPFEGTKRLLEKTVWINGFSDIVKIHQAAVSWRSGDEDFFLGATSGHHSLLFSGGLDGSPSVRVSTVKLDDVIDKDEAVSLLKIDVEGAELDVVKGAAELIKTNRDLALIMEFGASHLEHSGHSPHEWISALTDLGFVYRAINEVTGVLEDITLGQLELVDSVNIFFARPESQSWSKAGSHQ